MTDSHPRQSGPVMVVGSEWEELKRLRGFVSWLLSMDEPGSSARQTVTLTQIIDEARKAKEGSVDV